MTTNQGLVFVIIVCAVVLVIGLMRKKTEIVVNFILRIIMGCIGIYFVNEFLLMQNIQIAVGINPVTLLTVGTLGIPGFVLLYGIMGYGLL